MSIILKALKKAEGSKAGSRDRAVRAVEQQKTRSYKGKYKGTWGTAIAGIAVVVLLSFAGIYLFKSRSVPTPQLKPVDRVIDVKKGTAVDAKAEKPKIEKPAVVESSETAKLNADAIKEIKNKNYSSAEGILRKALLIKPDDAVAHNHLGLALKNQSRYKDASAEYEKALQIKPDYHEAMNNLAVTYEMLGDRDKAKSLYKKALSINPSYAEAHLNYALLLEAEGNKSEAESHYHTFLNLSSDATLKAKVKERLKGLGK